MSNFIIKTEQNQVLSKILSLLKEKKSEQDQLKPYLKAAIKNTPWHSDDKEHRIEDCGSYLKIRSDGTIVGANFCKNKLCPMCQWRISRKTYGKMMLAQDIVEESHTDLHFIFVTLTLRNMSSLFEGIEQILKAFNNLTHDRTFRALSHGFYRRVEITYNSNKNTWHPHIHMVVATKAEYFTKLYLRRAGWARLWKRNARIDYTPVVDVRRVSDDKSKAIAEIAKYTLKPFDVNRARAKPEELYTELLRATYNRRLSSYGGVYKAAVKAVGLKEDMDLIDSIIEDGSEEYYVFINGEYKPRFEYIYDDDTEEVQVYDRKYHS